MNYFFKIVYIYQSKLFFFEIKYLLLNQIVLEPMLKIYIYILLYNEKIDILMRSHDDIIVYVEWCLSYIFSH